MLPSLLAWTVRVCADNLAEGALGVPDQTIQTEILSYRTYGAQPSDGPPRLLLQGPQFPYCSIYPIAQNVGSLDALSAWGTNLDITAAGDHLWRKNILISHGSACPSRGYFCGESVHLWNITTVEDPCRTQLGEGWRVPMLAGDTPGDAAQVQFPDGPNQGGSIEECPTCYEGTFSATQATNNCPFGSTFIPSEAMRLVRTPTQYRLLRTTRSVSPAVGIITQFVSPAAMPGLCYRVMCFDDLTGQYNGALLANPKSECLTDGALGTSWWCGDPNSYSATPCQQGSTGTSLLNFETMADALGYRLPFWQFGYYGTIPAPAQPQGCPNWNSPSDPRSLRLVRISGDLRVVRIDSTTTTAGSGRGISLELTGSESQRCFQIQCNKDPDPNPDNVRTALMEYSYCSANQQSLVGCTDQRTAEVQAQDQCSIGDTRTSLLPAGSGANQPATPPADLRTPVFHVLGLSTGKFDWAGNTRLTGTALLDPKLLTSPSSYSNSTADFFPPADTWPALAEGSSRMTPIFQYVARGTRSLTPSTSTVQNWFTVVRCFDLLARDMYCCEIISGEPELFTGTRQAWVMDLERACVSLTVPPSDRDCMPGDVPLQVCRTVGAKFEMATGEAFDLSGERCDYYCRFPCMGIVTSDACDGVSTVGLDQHVPFPSDVTPATTWPWRIGCRSSLFNNLANIICGSVQPCLNRGEVPTTNTPDCGFGDVGCSWDTCSCIEDAGCPSHPYCNQQGTLHQETPTAIPTCSCDSEWAGERCDIPRAGLDCHNSEPARADLRPV